MSTRDLRIGDVPPDDMAREQDLEAQRGELVATQGEVDDMRRVHFQALVAVRMECERARASYATAAEERAEARTQLAYWRSKSAQQGAELAELREAYAALLASRPSDLETLLRASLEPTRMAMGNVSRSPVRAAGEAMASLTASDNEVAE